MPRTGRPPTPPDRARGHSVKVYLTPAERDELDRRIADEAAATGTAPDSRSDWLLRAAGIRRAAPTPNRYLSRFPVGSLHRDITTGEVLEVHEAGVDFCGQVAFKDPDGGVVCLTLKPGRFVRVRTSGGSDAR